MFTQSNSINHYLYKRISERCKVHSGSIPPTSTVPRIRSVLIRTAIAIVVLMGEHIDAHVLRKYQTTEKIGKGVRPLIIIITSLIPDERLMVLYGRQLIDVIVRRWPWRRSLTHFVMRPMHRGHSGRSCTCRNLVGDYSDLIWDSLTMTLKIIQILSD